MTQQPQRWYLKDRENNTYWKYDKFFNNEEEVEILLDVLKDYESVAENGTIDKDLVNEDVRITKTAFLDYEDERLLYFFKRICSFVINANNNNFNYNLTYIENLQYGIYNSQEKAHYTFHLDDHLYKRPINDTRKLSFSLLLSEPGVDFEGGDFIYRSGAIEDKIDFKKGTITFFPSMLPHAVAPVTKGVRRSIVGWVHGPHWT